MEKKQTVIKANVLYDGLTRKENMYIVLEGEKIIEVTNQERVYDYEGIVTPAFIDAHAHIGMDRDGEPYQEGETNDFSSQILPLNNPVNSIYLDDRAFVDAVDFGVLYSCIVPGSGNLIGGKAMIIKHFARFIDEAVVGHYGYKMALGYNPRSTTDWKGERPNTRMGVYSLLEQEFDTVLAKQAKAELQREKDLKKLEERAKKEDEKLTDADIAKEKEYIEKDYELAFNEKEKALLELLLGKKIAKVHVHKDDDVRYLIQLKKKYGFKCTADHTCDVFNQETFDALAENDIPVVYGPLGGVGYKVELKHAFYTNTKILMKSKAFFGFMTDHPVVHTREIRDCLKFFLIQGMSETEAISLITYKNAKILGIDDKLGTVEKGKLASIIVWDKEPLTLSAFPKAVFAEGKKVR
ncbi:MAG: amidohydrolase family protein [Candidatus Cloacimonetes bacterium]|nr:amidohydrolase family protein [Candidatus Cloacimonadota bacterium]